MKSLSTLEIDSSGKLLWADISELSPLNKLLPREVGTSVVDFLEDGPYKKNLDSIFSSQHASEFNLVRNYHFIQCTAHRHTPNKAFIHCKFVDYVPQPKSAPPQIENWGFKKGLGHDEDNEQQFDYLDQMLFFKDIAENIPIGITVINFFEDGSFFISFSNKEMQTIAPTFSKQDLNENNSHLFERTHPGDKAMFQDAMSGLFELKTFEIEIRIVDAGETKHLRLHAKPLYNKVGNFITAYIYLQDITEKKRLEERLEVIDYSFKNANVSIFLTKEDGGFFDVNELACSSLGYTREEVLAMKVGDLDPHYPEEKWGRHWKEISESKGLIFLSKHKKKDGSYIDVQINLKTVMYQGQEFHCSFVTDITEKKKLENKLKLVEHSFKTAELPMYFLTKDGAIYYYNEAMCNSLGYSKEEFGKMTLYDITTRHTLESWNKRWDAIKAGDTQTVSTKLIKKNKALIDVEVRTNIFEFEGMELTFSSFADVTQKKKVEEKLKLVDYAFKHTSTAQYFIFRDGSIYDFNEAACKLTGYSKEEFMGLSIFDISTRHTPETWEKRWDEIKNMGNHTNTTKIRRKDKAIVDVEITNDVFEYGDMELILSTLIDITEKVRKNEQLLLLEKVVTETTQSVIIADASEEKDTPIIYVNASFTKITGYTFEEVRGQNPRFLHKDGDMRNDLGRITIRNAIKKLMPWKVEVINKRKNGEPFWAEVLGFPVYDETKGRYTHWVAMQNDITSRKNAEEEKENLLKELIETNSELKQFGYITSHNLRAPLTNLVSICKMIDSEKVDDDKTKKLIDAFKKSTNQLNDTLNDLINILFIKENRNLEKTELLFEDVLEKVKDSISTTLINKKVKVETDFSNARSVKFVYAYLESIFLNLLTNSIKYAHPYRNPEIKIISAKGQDGGTKLIFSDNGIGMNMKLAKDKIFGLYQRFHSNADSKGIGLYLIHSQITALGGNIEVKSEEGVGTAFTITLK